MNTDRYLSFFKEAADRRKISHAYILEGGSEEERKELALGVAKMLLCEHHTGCGNCSSCHAIEHGTHPDVVMITHEKPDLIRIDDIRKQLVEDIQIRPYRGEYKIYIVEDAEKMNESAQNALLKTLEEPPSYGLIFLLTVNAEGFLPTILSRTVRIKMSYAGTGLENIADEDLRQILSVLSDIGKMDRTGIMGITDTWKNSNLSFAQIALIIRYWFRDMLILKSIGKRSQIVLSDSFYAIRDASERYSFARIEEILRITDRAEDRISRNVNYELAAEQLLLSMRWEEIQTDIADEGWEAGRFPDPEEAAFYAQMQAEEDYQ